MSEDYSNQCLNAPLRWQATGWLSPHFNAQCPKMPRSSFFYLITAAFHLWWSLITLGATHVPSIS